MGFKTPLKELFSFVYKATFDNGLTEHEFDHVILGYYDSEPIINHEEVTNWKWMNLEEIIKEIKTTPDNYTAWFKIIFDRFYNHIKA